MSSVIKIKTLLHQLFTTVSINLIYLVRYNFLIQMFHYYLKCSLSKNLIHWFAIFVDVSNQILKQIWNSKPSDTFEKLPIQIQPLTKPKRKERSKNSQVGVYEVPTQPQYLAQILNGNMQNLQAYNQQATQIHKYQVLPSCKFCGRTFNQESLKVHVNVCPKKVSTDTNVKKNVDVQMKKPRTLACCVCGREFGLLSLKIHYPQCIEKFENQQAKKAKEERRKAPRFSPKEIELFETKTDWTTQQIQAFNAKALINFKQKGMVHCQTCGRNFMSDPYQKHLRNCKQNSKVEKETKVEQAPQPQIRKPKVLTCFCCGRQFGLTSLKIHQKNCKQKFINNEKLKPKKQRRPTPSLPSDVLQRFSLEDAQNWQINQIQQYNKICNEVYRNQSMIECSLCKRKFIQQAYDRHLKNCQKNHQETITENKPQPQTVKQKILPKQSLRPKQSIPQPPPPKQIKVENVIPQTPEQFQETVVFQHLNKPNQEVQTINKIEQKQVSSQMESIENIQTPQIVSKIKHDKQETPKMKKSPQKAKKQIEPTMKNQSTLIQQSLQLRPCQKCGRKFLVERLLKHQSVCKIIKNNIDPKNAVKKILKNQQKNSQNAQNAEKVQTIKQQMPPENHEKLLVPCSKCGRRFLQNRVSIHEQNCKGKGVSKNEQLKQEKPVKLEKIQKQNKIQQPKVKNPQPTQINPIKDINSQNYQTLDLKACSKCQRKFASERLEVHQNVCKGKTKPKLDAQEKGKTMQIIKKTKQNFYKMVQDIKGKKIKQEEVDRQLEEQLKTITAAQTKNNKKQAYGENHNTEFDKIKEVASTSVSKWNKVSQNRRSNEKDKKHEKIESHLPKI